MKKYLIMLLTLALSVPFYAFAEDEAPASLSDLGITSTEEFIADAQKAPAIPTDEEIMAKQDSSPLVTINGVDVPKWLYDNALRDSLAGAQKLDDEELDEEAIKSKVLHNLVDIEVLYQEAQKQGVAINEGGGALRSTIIAKKYKDEADFKRTLAQAGMTEAQFAAIWQQQASANQLIEEKVLSEVFMTDDDLHARYEQDKHKYTRRPKIQASHILIKVDADASEEERAAALAKAEGLHKEALSCADFAELAKEHSDCPSAAEGGDLGMFGEKKMVKPFSDVAFALKVGEISGVVETKFGYHIIMKTAEQDPIAPLEEIEEILAGIILQEKGIAAFTEYKDALVKRAIIIFHNPDIEAAYAKK